MPESGKSYVAEFRPQVTSEEKTLRRSKTARDVFPDRVIEFIVDSVQNNAVRYGINSPQRICRCLLEAGKRQLVHEIASDAVSLALSLGADVRFEREIWNQQAVPTSAVLDVLMSRLTHPENLVRVKAAQSIARLIVSNQAPDALPALIVEMRNTPLEWKRYAGMLTCLLISNERSDLVRSYLPIMRDIWEGTSLLGQWTFNQLCDLCGSQEMKLDSSNKQPQLTVSVQAAGNIDKALKLWPMILQDVQAMESKVTGFRAVFDSYVLEGGTAALDPDEHDELMRMFYDYSTEARNPVETRARAQLETAFLAAVTALRAEGRIPTQQAFFTVSRQCPIDASFARIVPQPRPYWIGIDEAEVKEDEHLKIVSTSVDRRCKEIFTWSETTASMIVAANWGMAKESLSERSIVQPFLYRVVGAMPDAKDVWVAVSESIILNQVPNLSAFDYLNPDDLIVASNHKMEISVEGLRILPLALPLRRFGGYWHALPAYYDAYLLNPMFGDDDLQVLFNGTITYHQNLQTIAKGWYWQDGMPRSIFSKGVAFDGGYVLEISPSWVQEVLTSFGARLGWVRYTEFTLKRKRPEEAKNYLEYQLYGVSPVAIAYIG